MCLDRVTSLEQGGEGVGWKVFKCTLTADRVLRPPCQPNYGTYAEGEWLSDCLIGTLMAMLFMDTGNTRYYPTGFHLFTTREGALAWKQQNEVVRQVKYRSQVACGTQAGFPVVVAKEIRIRRSSRRS